MPISMGRLIVFEGPDGVGKSTLARKLFKHLEKSGLASEYVAFPGKEAGTIGRLIYDLHHDLRGYGVDEISPASLQALHIAAHLDVIERRIQPALDNGTWIVLDRFWWSTWVYGVVSGVDRDVLEAMIGVERRQWRYQHPDCLFLIRRHGGDRDANGARLEETYQGLFDREQMNYPMFVIHNDATLDQSLRQILSILHELFDGKCDLGGTY